MLVLLERGIFYGEKDIYDIYCWSGYFTFVFYYTTKADTRGIFSILMIAWLVIQFFIG